MKWRGLSGIILCLLICLLLCGCASKSDNQDKSEDPETEQYVIAIPSWKSAEQLEEITGQINAILKEQLGFEVTILAFPIDRYSMEMQKLMAGTRQVDIMFVFRNYVENWMLGNLMPLDSCLPEYGPDILALTDEEAMNSCRINQQLYGIPTIRDYAVTTDTYFLNRRLLENCGYLAEDITSMEILNQVFAKVHALDENTVILSTNLEAVTENRQNLNSQTQFISVLDEQQDCYINYLASEEYRNILQEIRSWQQKGYVGFSLENGDVIRADGTVFAEARCGKPGAREEVSRQRGEEYVEVNLGRDIITQNVYTFYLYTITHNTRSVEGSMKLLNELYRNPELNRLISEIQWSWFAPNLFLTDVPEGAPSDLWEQTQAYNDQALRAPDVDFVFDPTAVIKEYMDVRQIYESYKPVLENGLVDVDEGLSRMLAQLEDAGIDAVIAEQNRQYKEWKNSKID